MFEHLYDQFNVLPADIDEYLRDSESRIIGTIPNTEKKVIWHGGSSSVTELSIIYIHGYSATRQEVSPLIENIAKQFQCNVFFTRLTGHGNGSQAMADVTLEKLLLDTVEAFHIGQRIGKRVIVIGNSTGATLSTWLALQACKSMHSLVLLSPNYGLRRKMSEWLTVPVVNKVMSRFYGTYQFEPSNDLHGLYWTTSYPFSALIPMMQAVKMVRRCRLQNITVPILTMYAEEDDLLNVKAIKETFAKFGSLHKELLRIEGTQGKSHHILAGDIQSPVTNIIVEQSILRFLNSVPTAR